MDIQRDKPRDYRKWILIGAGVVGGVAGVVALMRLTPAAPTVEA